MRAYWEAGGFLQTGILFDRLEPNLSPDQGYRELAALVTACECFRRISGTIQVTRKEKEKENAIRQTGFSISAQGKELIAPAISVLTGGLVGAGAFVASSSDPVGAALAGLIAALGASAVFKFSSTRTRTGSLEREYTFMPKTDIQSLDRAIPSLIQRMRRAGLVPIFVIDELDKVDNLSGRIDHIVRQ